MSSVSLALTRLPTETSRREMRPGDRRADLGEFHVELGAAQRRLGAVERRAGGERELWRRWSAVCSVMLPDLPQRVGPLEVALGEVELAWADATPACASSQRIPIGPLVDGEEQVALLDHRAVGEMDLVEIARHAGPQVDRIDGLEAADEIVALGDLLDDGSRDGDRRRVLRRDPLRVEQRGQEEGHHPTGRDSRPKQAGLFGDHLRPSHRAAAVRNRSRTPIVLIRVRRQAAASGYNHAGGVPRTGCCQWRASAG